MKNRAIALALALAMILALPAMAAGESDAFDGTDTGFVDVEPASWYARNVILCARYGLMQGVGDDVFAPNDTMERAMAVKVLHNLAGSPKPSATSSFDDVPDGEWYSDAVAWAVGEGIVYGYSDTTFGPHDPVTREQMAALLWRYADCPDADPGDDFVDEASISDYAVTAVDWAQANGVITGHPDGRFDPAGNASRAQAAAILSRYLTLAGMNSHTQTRSMMDRVCAASGIAKADDGTLLITDVYNKVVWKLVDGVSSIYAGDETVPDLYGEPVGGYNDAELEESYFAAPWAIVPFINGWAVSDADNGAVRLLEAEGTQTVNSTTDEDLKKTDLGVSFEYPTGLATDGENLYVADTHAGAIRRITPDGELSTVADELNDPMGMCWADGSLYVAETGANRIIKITGKRVTVVAGTGEDDYLDGDAKRAAFSGPQGVAVGNDGAVYVSDTGNSAVRMVRDGVVTTLVSRDVNSKELAPVSPTGLLVDGDTLYVCDSFARKVLTLELK